jgi:F-type H+-transporting ATPase subunit a
LTEKLSIAQYDNLKLFGVVVVTETMRNMWIVMGILLVFALVVRIKLRSFKAVPAGFQNFVELIVEMFDNFVVSTMGEKYGYFANWFFGVFAFILLSNLSGLLTLRPPTADIACTAALGVSTFLMIHFFGLAKNLKAYVQSYFQPLAFLFPINLISEVAVPVSLSFRLFGANLGGFILMSLIYNMFPLFLLVGIPSVLHGYFDVFAGALQAYIFTILSMTFIRGKLPD